MELMLKICAIALVGVIACAVISRTLPEMSIAATLATQFAVIFVASGTIGSVIKFIYALAEKGGISDALILPLMKTVGISIVTKLACDMCRDSGVSAVASYIELCGGAVAISFSIPLMMSVIEQITA